MTKEGSEMTDRAREVLWKHIDATWPFRKPFERGSNMEHTLIAAMLDLAAEREAAEREACALAILAHPTAYGERHLIHKLAGIIRLRSPEASAPQPMAGKDGPSAEWPTAAEDGRNDAHAAMAKAREVFNEGRLPDRECFWLIERNCEPPQYVEEGNGLTDDPWRARGFKTERDAHDHWRTLTFKRDEFRVVEHMFIYKGDRITVVPSQPDTGTKDWRDVPVTAGMLVEALLQEMNTDGDLHTFIERLALQRLSKGKNDDR